MDTVRAATFARRAMASDQKDSRIRVDIVLDTVLTAIAFVIFFFVCRGHVPSNDPKMINLWGAITSSCLTGVFWLTLQMFKVTLRGQREVESAKK